MTTPPLPPSEGELNQPPPRDELDILLREWHARPAADRGRERLLEALEREDDPAAPIPFPKPSASAAPAVVVRARWLKITGVAASLLLAGSITFLAMRGVSHPNVSGSSGVRDEASKVAPHSAAPEMALKKEAAATDELAPAGRKADTGSVTERLNVGEAESKFAGGNSDRSAERDLALSSRAAEPVAAAPAPPTGANAAVAPSSRVAPASVASGGSALRTADTALEARGPEPQFDKFNPVAPPAADTAHAAADEDEVLSARARQVLSPVLQEVAVRNFQRQNATLQNAGTQNEQIAASPPAEGYKRAPAGSAAGKPASSPAPTTGETLDQRHVQSRPFDDARATQNSENLPVLLRLNRVNPATSTFILGQAGVRNLRFTTPDFRVVEGDASEDFLLNLAEFSFVDRVELRPTQTEQVPANAKHAQQGETRAKSVQPSDRNDAAPAQQPQQQHQP